MYSFEFLLLSLLSSYISFPYFVPTWSSELVENIPRKVVFPSKSAIHE